MQPSWWFFIGLWAKCVVGSPIRFCPSSQCDGLDDRLSSFSSAHLTHSHCDCGWVPAQYLCAATRDVYLAVSSCLHLALITCSTAREKATAWPRLCQSANTSWTVHVPGWFQRLLLRGFDKFTKTNTVRAFKHQSWLFFLRGNRIQTPRPNKWKHGPKKSSSFLFFFFSFLPPHHQPLLSSVRLNESRLGYM